MKQHIIKIFIILLTLGSCKKNDPLPQVSTNFTSDKTIVLKGDTVSFIDQSTGNPDEWNWSFENGQPTTSSDQNPKVIYSIEGVHFVTLTSRNSEYSDTENKVEYIQVLSEVTTNFSIGDTIIDQRNQVNFFDLSSGSPTNWHWTFEGGSPASSSEQNPTINYDNPGFYSVTLESSNQLSSDNVTRTDVIIVLPTDSLVAYYPFSGDYNDQSGNNNDATNNGVVLTNDVFGTPYSSSSFNGKSFLEVPNSATLNFSNTNFSISLWVKTSSSAMQMILQKGGINGINDSQYWLRLNDHLGDITFFTGNGIDPIAYVSSNSSSISDNLWHHLVIVRNGSNLQIYINNSLASEVASIQKSVDNNQSLKIGVQVLDFNRNFFIGDMDEIRIYNKSLTIEEVNILNNSK